MKHVVSALVLTILASTSAYAETFMVQGSVTRVDPNWVKEQVTTPYKECTTVEVPVYGNPKQNTEGAILGGIIGGVIGNQIGKGSGNDVATGVGAITGAIIGGKGRDEIVGYRQEERCSVRYHTVYKDRISDYLVYWNWNGYKGQFYSTTEYKVGETFTMNLSLNPSR